MFLKIYIKAFQLASDLDDTVEDKLLIGDRPKPSNDPETKLPLKERLAMRKQEEINEVRDLPLAVMRASSADILSQLSPDEAAYYDYATALSEWLTPYHDYARPPPSVVLAEAAKLTEQKTGHTLKGLELPPDAVANGNWKKDEEPPAVVEPPSSISKHFDGEKFLDILLYITF